MSYRKFVDRDGNVWEVKERSRSEWSFEPAAGNPHPSRSVQPPGYENDPFELSDAELQRLFDKEDRGRSRPLKSPFAD